MQLGKPMVVYTGLKADLEGFTDAGMVGYASDLNVFGFFNNVSWNWLNNLVRYEYSDNEPALPTAGMIWIDTDG